MKDANARHAVTMPAVVADYKCQIGENPLWHAAEKRLYWGDIPRGRIFRYDPADGRHEQVLQEGIIGGFTLQENGGLLLFMDRGVVKEWKDGILRVVVDGLPGEEKNRFNAVIADPLGRVLCGTMFEDRGRKAAAGGTGSLYRLDTDGGMTPLLTGLGISNGLGFSPDHALLYHADSASREISRYRYDAGSGTLSDKQLFVQLPRSLGLPDGLTVDAKGYVWVAVWGGSCVIRFSPTAKEEQRVYFPARLVSSVAFGGADMRDLYVTTAGGEDKAKNGPGAGALYRLRTGAKGMPEHLSRVAAAPRRARAAIRVRRA